jgi:hypothetical protein
MVKRKPRRARDPHPGLALAGLVFAPAQPPAGTPRKGEAKPSRHEQAVLRAAARSFVMRTHRRGGVVFVYGDSGEAIRGESGNPLTEGEFGRFTRNGWLVGDKDSLFDEPAQRWDAKWPRQS